MEGFVLPDRPCDARKLIQRHKTRLRGTKETEMNAPSTQPTISLDGFSIDILVQGFPGKTVCHGGLGWSTVALLRGRGHVILIDSGNFGMRRLISELGYEPHQRDNWYNLLN